MFSKLGTSQEVVEEDEDGVCIEEEVETEDEGEADRL